MAQYGERRLLKNAGEVNSSQIEKANRLRKSNPTTILMFKF